ncbi:TadE-like protein [Murinocardiopsis flavida]|uniref:TadE-like protein n=1 Tax=Murinocardiopsis flavida TaxID=645275 RepID=A0A2P8DG24_9ACTN|nr:TadE/TadG family type IV pilus assembly protein [Murinocardiopsis flavida]PSK96163.1 TadE-like protein [Murinocardiopsis flavida]
MRGERGAAAVELLLIAPVVIAAALLMVLAGRQVSAQMAVDASAHAAARTASLHTDPAAARTAAERSAAATLGPIGRVCASHSLTLELDGLRPGGTVTARLDCRTDLGGLGPLSDPAGRTITGRAAVGLDTYRGTP